MTNDSYQLLSGLMNPILEDVHLIPWMPHGWLSYICKVLYSTNSTIWLKHPWTPCPCQHNNWCIMDDVLHCIPLLQAKIINNVRIYLCITMLLEVTHTNGMQLMPHHLKPTAKPSNSTMHWPYQPHPPNKDGESGKPPFSSSTQKQTQLC